MDKGVRPEPLGPTEEHFRSWLRGLGTGCEFAARLTDRKSFFCYRHGTSLLARKDVETTIRSLIVDAVAAKQPAYVLFPHIRTANGIARMLQTLDGTGGWIVRRVAWRKHERSAVLLSLHWNTPAGPPSSAVGFAPLGTMPATRRGPFVALGVWGGAQDNKHMRPRPADSAVGIIDIPSGHKSKDEHTRMLKKTDERVRTLLADPAEDVEHLRQVGFCLPHAAVGRALFPVKTSRLP